MAAPSFMHRTRVHMYMSKMHEAGSDARMYVWKHAHARSQSTPPEDRPRRQFAFLLISSSSSSSLISSSSSSSSYSAASSLSESTRRELIAPRLSPLQ